jgi:hypothetical protein
VQLLLLLLTTPLIALLTPLSLNLKAFTLIIDIYESATYTLVLQIINNTNNNINLLFLFILNTITLIKDNTIRLLLH